MLVARKNHINTPLLIEQVPEPQPSAGEVLIRIKAAGLNHRDLWILKGAYGDDQYPCILGSDGAGVVEELGSGVDDHWLNQRVLINPSLNWGPRRQHQGRDFEILGMPSQGTFAQKVCVPVVNVFPLPGGFTYEQAAALPLGGLTAYRALFYRGNAQPGQNVLITGIGGGVATMLLQFAAAAGLNVYVSSSSDEKIQNALSLKAVAGVNYSHPTWNDELRERLPEGFDLVIDGAGGENFPILLELVTTGGKIVTYGGTAGKIPRIIPRSIFWNQISILGTTMGSPMDFSQMLEFVEQHNIHPVVDRVFLFKDILEAFDHLTHQQQFGKVVLTLDE